MRSQIEQSVSSAADETAPAEQPRRATFDRRRKLVVSAGVALISVGWVGYWLWSMESGLKHARRAASRGDWGLTRDHLASYLKLHPQDPEARMLMAEAFVKDNTGEAREYTRQAIRHLQAIGDDSTLAAEARLQEARLTLLILLQPARAEQLLRKSLKLNPDSYDANLLMWKILDLTGRHVSSREFFWRVYELAPESKRALRLRDWFFAEFYPEIANETFTRALGAKKIGKTPASMILLVRFRENEPGAMFVHAALAAHYLQVRNPKSSLETLRESPDLSRAMRDPFFVATLFATLVDLGEFQKANSCFEKWPGPHSGYLFWRSEGMFRQHVSNDAAAAVTSYQKALTQWPAKFDWNLKMKLSGCLRKIGRSGEAKRLQSRVEYLTTKVLTHETTTRLRNRIRDLRNPVVAQEFRDFYREFDLKKEADAWEEHRQKLIRFARNSNR